MRAAGEAVQQRTERGVSSCADLPGAGGLDRAGCDMQVVDDGECGVCARSSQHSGWVMFRLDDIALSDGCCLAEASLRLRDGRVPQ